MVHVSVPALTLQYGIQLCFHCACCVETHVPGSSDPVTFCQRGKPLRAESPHVIGRGSLCGLSGCSFVLVAGVQVKGLGDCVNLWNWSGCSDSIFHVEMQR